MENTKEINIKYLTYYFFNVMINIIPDQLKIYKKSYKKIGIYYIEYVTIKNRTI